MLTREEGLSGERRVGGVEGLEGGETMAKDEGSVEVAAMMDESEVDLDALKKRVVVLAGGYGLGGQ